MDIQGGIVDIGDSKRWESGRGLRAESYLLHTLFTIWMIDVLNPRLHYSAIYAYKKSVSVPLKYIKLTNFKHKRKI